MASRWGDGAARFLLQGVVSLCDTLLQECRVWRSGHRMALPLVVAGGLATPGHNKWGHCMWRQCRAVSVGLGAVLFVAAGVAQAQEMLAVQAEPRQAVIDTPVQLKVDFHLQGYANPLCGIEINFGDGTVRKVRIGENGERDFPYAATHTYAQQGAYQVTVSGAFVVRGLRSVAPCNGKALNTTVTVSPPLRPSVNAHPNTKAAEPSPRDDKMPNARPTEDDRQLSNRRSAEGQTPSPERNIKSPPAPANAPAQPSQTAKNPKPASNDPPANKRVGRFILQPSAGETN